MVSSGTRVADTDWKVQDGSQLSIAPSFMIWAHILSQWPTPTQQDRKLSSNVLLRSSLFQRIGRKRLSRKREEQDSREIH